MVKGAILSRAGKSPLGGSSRWGGVCLTREASMRFSIEGVKLLAVMGLDAASFGGPASPYSGGALQAPRSGGQGRGDTPRTPRARPLV